MGEDMTPVNIRSNYHFVQHFQALQHLYPELWKRFHFLQVRSAEPGEHDSQQVKYIEPDRPDEFLYAFYDLGEGLSFSVLLRERDDRYKEGEGGFFLSLKDTPVEPYRPMPATQYPTFTLSESDKHFFANRIELAFLTISWRLETSISDFLRLLVDPESMHHNLEIALLLPENATESQYLSRIAERIMGGTELFFNRMLSVKIGRTDRYVQVWTVDLLVAALIDTMRLNDDKVDQLLATRRADVLKN